MLKREISVDGIEAAIEAELERQGFEIDDDSTREVRIVMNTSAPSRMGAVWLSVSMSRIVRMGSGRR